MALNCFKLKETDLERLEGTKGGSRATTCPDAAMKIAPPSSGTEVVIPVNDSNSTRFDKLPRKSGTYDNAHRSRPMLSGRYSGFNASTFSSCISAKREATESPYAALDTPTNGNCFRQTASSQRSHATEIDPLGSDLYETQFTQQTTGAKTKAFGCLVRSQSDSTCLSIKTHKSPIAPESAANADHGPTATTATNARVDDVPYDSLSSIADTSTLDPLHSSSSELDAYPVNVELYPNSELSNRSGVCDPMHSCALSTGSPIDSETTKPFRPVTGTRTYQLVCRDGIQSYEVVTSTHVRESSLGSDCNTRVSDDSCVSPVPSDKHRSTMSNADDAKQGLSTPSNAGHGIKAHLVAGPSSHSRNSSNTSGSNSRQSPHPSLQSPYPTQGQPLSPPQHLRADPMRGANVSYLSSPSSHHMIPSSHIGSGSSTSTPPGRTGTRKSNSTTMPLEHVDSQAKPDKPAAPLPLRKQRTTSPPTAQVDQYHPSHQHRLPYHPTGQHRSSQPSGAQESKVRSVWSAQRNLPPENTEYAYAYGDSSNSSYVSNRNSGGSSDLTTPSSPRRSPRSTGLTETSRTPTAASGTQVANLYNPRHGYVRQATVVQAPANGNAASTGVVEGVSSSSSSSTAASKRMQSYSHQPPPRTSPDRFAVPSDTGSEMTVSELRSIAERQRQQLSRQAHQIQSREERLAYLRATQSNREGSEQVPSAGSELTQEQETRLQQLRGNRGQTERIRLSNDSLVKEIDNFARLLSSNEQELEACRRRKEEAQRILSLISHCLSCISNIPGQRKTGTSKGSDAASAELERPVDLLSFQLPFTSDRDKKRWRDGLMEADYLDRQISLAISHNSPAPHGAVSPGSTGYDVLRMPNSRSCKSSATIPASITGQGVATKAGSANLPGDSGGLTSQPTTSSGFSSLLSRASSPPTSRRSSLRMLLHAANSPGAYPPGGKDTAAASQTGVTFSFPRLKAPPRYASRAVINETYMRRIRRDRVENYKRTANEIYRANVDRMTSKQQQLTSTESQTESETSSPQGHNSIAASSARNASEVQIGQTDKGRLASSNETESKQEPSPLDSVSSSSSSSLELVGIESTSLEVIKTQHPNMVAIDEETKHALGEVDSGLGGSDDTGPSERTQTTASNEPLHAVERSTRAVVYVVEDAQGADRSQIATPPISDIKSILRKSSKSQSGGYSTKTVDSGADITSDACPSSNSSQSRSNSVRFHPLALLLDAALEGDIELVKKAAAQVSDVSEPNDEGITALHNAVCAGRMDIADFLVRTAGADVNAGDTDGWTPLHCAASCANLPLARLLVEHGASLHARTLSDQETPFEKCDQGDDEAECEEYLYFQQERLGSAASGRVYALFPRGLEAAGPGSADAHLEPDELAVSPNEPLTIIDREPQGETEWMLAEKADGTRGLIPRSHISCYPLVRVPPASLPIPLRTPPLRRLDWWDDEDADEVGGVADLEENDGDVQEVEEDDEELTAPVEKGDGVNEEPRSPVLVEVDVSQRETPDLDLVAEPVPAAVSSSELSQPKVSNTASAANITVSSRLNINPIGKSKEVTEPKGVDVRDLKTAL